MLLGSMYYDGEGVKQNYRLAAHWYTKSAEQGVAAVQLRLGYMHYDGVGVTKNYKQTAYWLRKAADQNLALAQLLLGNHTEKIILNGNCTRDNYDDSRTIYWNRKAAEQGDANAQYNLGIAYEE